MVETLTILEYVLLLLGWSGIACDEGISVLLLQFRQMGFMYNQFLQKSSHYASTDSM